MLNLTRSYLVKLIYSGHALSCKALSSASLQACHLDKQNVTGLKIPTGRRQTSWLFTERDQRFELGTTEEQIPLVAQKECIAWSIKMVLLQFYVFYKVSYEVDEIACNLVDF